jgi:hypothetical protein
VSHLDAFHKIVFAGHDHSRHTSREEDAEGRKTERFGRRRQRRRGRKKKRVATARKEAS